LWWVALCGVLRSEVPQRQQSGEVNVPRHSKLLRICGKQLCDDNIHEAASVCVCGFTCGGIHMNQLVEQGGAVSPLSDLSGCVAPALFHSPVGHSMHNLSGLVLQPCVRFWVLYSGSVGCCETSYST
jgi:hypothetical protein